MKKKFWCVLISVVLICSMLPATTFAADLSPVEEAANGVVRLITDNGGLGTGFFVGKVGDPVEWLVTNRHVVEDTDGRISNYVVAAFNHDSEGTMETTEVEVVELISGADLVLCRLIDGPTTKRNALPLKATEYVRRTDTVAAIGFPGLSDINASENLLLRPEEATITTGTVTLKDVNQGETGICMQVDAQLANGNSGGPLVTTEDGYVVGINVMFSRDYNATTAYYAVNIDYIIDALEDRNVAFDQYSPAAGEALNAEDAVGMGLVEETTQVETSMAKAETKENILLFIGAILLIVGALAALMVVLVKKAKQRDVWRCKVCGTVNDTPRCKTCGNMRENNRDTVEPEPTDLWTCPNCEHKNSAKFCAACGYEKEALPPMPPQTKEWECKNCGTSNAEYDSTCRCCGAHRNSPISGGLKKRVEERPPTYSDEGIGLKGGHSFSEDRADGIFSSAGDL